jgi:hypothetical protein
VSDAGISDGTFFTILWLSHVDEETAAVGRTGPYQSSEEMPQAFTDRTS